MIREREYAAMSGWAALVILLAAAGVSLWRLVVSIRADEWAMVAVWALAITFSLFLLFGLFIVNPNEGKVLQLFGSYAGTAKTPGLR